MFEAVKHTLMRSLRQVVLTQQFVRSKGVEVGIKQLVSHTPITITYYSPKSINCGINPYRCLELYHR